MNFCIINQFQNFIIEMWFLFYYIVQMVDKDQYLEVGKTNLSQFCALTESENAKDRIKRWVNLIIFTSIEFCPFILV